MQEQTNYNMTGPVAAEPPAPQAEVMRPFTCAGCGFEFRAASKFEIWQHDNCQPATTENQDDR